ncbi:hypothetical protein ACIBFB_05500 [Nocardiopsis sp. NPDC050513]|uniref:hypothetical protein n=1 Tax=Nocardiopsis sp. NPDC050513 TaxID=3364338 RepID=UPI0037BD2367
MIDKFVDAVESVVTNMLTFWIDVPSMGIEDGEVAAAASDPPSAGLATLLGYFTWIGLGVAVLSLIILGAMLAIARSRGEGGQHLGRIVIVLGAVALISGAASLISGLLNTMDSTSAGGAAGFLQSRLFFYVGIAATASAIFGGVKMAWEQRAEPGKDLLKSLLTLVVVSGVSVTAISTAIGVGDEFSEWIIDEAAAQSDIGEITTGFVAVMGFGSLATGPGALVLVLVLGLIIVIAGLVQIVLMMIRDGMLVLLAGVLPLTAAFTNTQMGKSWFQKAVSWVVAFLLYKPVAAIIYALVFVLLQVPDGDQSFGEALRSVLLAVTMLFLAIFALPALMKFVTPMVGATAGGALAAGAASMASQMPTGAGSGGGGGSSGSGGSSTGGGGPTGGKNAPGGPSGGKAPSTRGSTGGTGAQTGTQAATQAGSSGAGSAAMKSNPKTAAIYAAAKAVQKGAEKAQQSVDDTAGGDGPSGSA